MPLIYYRCNIYPPKDDMPFASNPTCTVTIVTLRIGIAAKFVTRLKYTGLYILLHPYYCKHCTNFLPHPNTKRPLPNNWSHSIAHLPVHIILAGIIDTVVSILYLTSLHHWEQNMPHIASDLCDASYRKKLHFNLLKMSM